MDNITRKITQIVTLLLLIFGLQASPISAAPPPIETEEEGLITIQSFNRLLREYPDSVYFIDVRDQTEVDADGTFKTAMVLPIDEVGKAVDKLPTDKPIVFFCSTGGRAGEAYDTFTMLRENLKVYFLDANVEFSKQEYPKITPAE